MAAEVLIVNAALLFLLHPVHNGCAFMHFADLVGPTGVIQDPLGRGGLTGIDVEPLIPIFRIFSEWYGAGHKCFLFSKAASQRLPAIMQAKALLASAHRDGHHPFS